MLLEKMITLWVWCFCGAVGNEVAGFQILAGAQ